MVRFARIRQLLPSVALGLVVAVTISSVLSTDTAGAEPQDLQRALYHAARGYDFDPDQMRWYEMDARVKDIETASKYKARGYNFDPGQMRWYEMDARVKDIEAASKYQALGYTFDPDQMHWYEMDARVKDIETASKYRTRGYNFDPDEMHWYEMDARVRDVEAASSYRMRGQREAPREASVDADRSAESRIPGEARKAIQEALLQLGFDPGPVDGIIGPRTLAALSEFSRDRLTKSTQNTTRHSTNHAEVSGLGSRDRTSELQPSIDRLRLYQRLLEQQPHFRPPVAENGSYYGQISPTTLRPKTVHVQGYYRKDGTYVRGHYRSRPRR